MVVKVILTALWGGDDGGVDHLDCTDEGEQGVRHDKIIELARASHSWKHGGGARMNYGGVRVVEQPLVVDGHLVRRAVGIQGKYPKAGIGAGCREGSRQYTTVAPRSAFGVMQVRGHAQESSAHAHVGPGGGQTARRG